MRLFPIHPFSFVATLAAFLFVVAILAGRDLGGLSLPFDRRPRDRYRLRGEDDEIDP